MSHLTAAVVDPPAKQRKLVEPTQPAQPTTQSAVHRPPSAQSIARPGTAACLRPPSRVNGPPQSVPNPRLPQSTTTRPASIYSSNAPRNQLRLAVSGQPSDNLRAKAD